MDKHDFWRPIRWARRGWFLGLFALIGIAIAAVAAEPKNDSTTKAVPPRPGDAHPGDSAKSESSKGESAKAEAAIRATAAAFVKAFNAGDAKAIARLFTANASVADDEGKVLRGRKAIEDEYAALFKQHPTARIEVAVRSVELPTPTTAVEDGEAQVLTRDNSPPTASRYTAFHVQEEGKWLMASVRESGVPVHSNFPELEELAWAVGTWEARQDGFDARFRLRWIANKNYLQRDFSAHRGTLLASSGTQIIGWDPRARQIVSWTFDSTGGYSYGRWTRTPEGWQIESEGMTADGQPTSSKDTFVHVPGDDNVFGYSSLERRVGDTRTPDFKEIAFDRVPEKK